MYISQETPEQTQQRLLKVIAEARLETFTDTYIFNEFLLEEFPAKASMHALAFVRDEEVWSELVPSQDANLELFTLFSFHFKNDLDNSGFVGWLASHLKATLGTGVFVVCGQNSREGGIFDYWGSPVALGKQVLQEVETLRKQGKAL